MEMYKDGEEDEERAGSSTPSLVATWFVREISCRLSGRWT